MLELWSQGAEREAWVSRVREERCMTVEVRASYSICRSPDTLVRGERESESEREGGMCEREMRREKAKGLSDCHPSHFHCDSS